VKPGCLKAALERLEPCVGKLTSTVLMGLGFRNEPWLPDQSVLFGFKRETSVVQPKIDALYVFVPSAIYSRKKQMPVFKRQLLVSI
jgi:hypothetical protein